jgi:hypothetical protein
MAEEKNFYRRRWRQQEGERSFDENVFGVFG